MSDIIDINEDQEGISLRSTLKASSGDPQEICSTNHTTAPEQGHVSEELKEERGNPLANPQDIYALLRDFDDNPDSESTEEHLEGSSVALPRALEIKDDIDKKVIGQEQAKLLLSVLFSMHIHRKPAESSSQRPPNAIIVGPTGVGKTHTLRVASELLMVPFLTVDSTTLVPSGGRGVQIGNVVEDLITLADSIMEKNPILKKKYKTPKLLAEKGVVFFDEFDKVAVFGKENASSGGNSLDAWNMSVQRTLLKFCEGSLVGVGVRDPSGEYGTSSVGTIDTSGILVLAGGAFQGISDSKIRSRRPEALQREIKQQTSVISNDFVAFGMMPELVARLQVLVEFKGLSTDDLQKILENTHTSPIQVWIRHFEQLGKKVTFTTEAIRFVAGRASLLDLGARGLHQILFPALASMTYAMEMSDDNEIIIDADQLKKWLSRVGY